VASWQRSQRQRPQLGWTQPGHRSCLPYLESMLLQEKKFKVAFCDALFGNNVFPVGCTYQPCAALFKCLFISIKHFLANFVLIQKL
jgi:hypothetical protein